jgi:serine/threonine protein phosphatase PrpC
MFRQFLSRSSLCERSVSFLFAVATVAVLRPVVAEAAAVKRQRDDCPPYGCVLRPRDIFYDRKSQEALEQLRNAADEDDESVSSESTEQALLELLMSGDEESATLTLIGFKGGDPSNQINQDRAFCINPFTFDSNSRQRVESRLLGVFDGHAKRGELVSEHSVQQFPSLLANKLKRLGLKPQSLLKENTITQVKNCLEDTFVHLNKTAPASPTGGCTASVILQLGNKLFIANAGDSRSFVCVHQASTNTTEVVYITREDKPDLADERARVEMMGGKVYIPHRSGASSRVIYQDTSTGMQSGLAMSRSIGDWEATGVIPNPIVDVIDIDSLVQQRRFSEVEDDVLIFVVSATDGMMDYVPAEAIAKILVPALIDKDGDHPLTACERLISWAAAGWQKARDGRYRDDIAIAVSKIRSPPVRKTKDEL